MVSQADDSEQITAVPPQELPPEFKKFDRIFGFIPPHIWNTFVIVVITYPCMVLYYLYLLPFGHVPWGTAPLIVPLDWIMGLGITVGCHRLWTHKSFKAKLPLEVLLMLFQTAMLQHPIFKWCQDHRVHHKHTDTDADPHNSKRGFWFSHVGWLLVRPHPDLQRALASVDMSDLVRNPVIRFQSRWYWELVLLMWLVFPVAIAHWLFPQMTLVELFIWNGARHATALNATFCVNSVAHIWGDKPYDKYISSSENKWVSFFALGEGWHNYHHTFPWDYKTAELGWKLNFSTMFIDLCAKIGWAYDLKTVSHKMLADRINRTGDAAHSLYKTETVEESENKQRGEMRQTLCWGWGDKQLSKQDVEVTERLHSRLI